MIFTLQGQATFGFGQYESIAINGNNIIIGSPSAGTSYTAVMLYSFENGAYQMKSIIRTGDKTHVNFGHLLLLVKMVMYWQ